jgi:hypothetical protein
MASEGRSEPVSFTRVSECQRCGRVGTKYDLYNKLNRAAVKTSDMSTHNIDEFRIILLPSEVTEQVMERTTLGEILLQGVDHELGRCRCEDTSKVLKGY